MKTYLLLLALATTAINATPTGKRTEDIVNTSSSQAGYHPDCGTPNSTKLCQERYSVSCNDDGSLNTGNYSYCGIQVCKCKPN
ncbi:uncharacterized protein GGS22DRAFT_174887 [Annulohypoxylon maeteangense]|uniref:uncharacterized protein n=1 Tax=Annulohypoxylon maeteangense TaxID=1927788 RepID=UPI002008B401|nr:uncharacterized protein GGS22DRAFT_174887 [Annulohypoxylon maeteangense]KAI0880449.1 hypothetical protein GGS22DRAFT_174887 [Annulohypoxylon maeteangense]